MLKLIIGIIIILTGIVMAIVGVGMFTYSGNLDPIVSTIGKYCFLLWSPNIIAGIVILIIPKRFFAK